MLNPGLTSQKVFFVVKKYNSKHSKNTELNKIMIRNVTHFLGTSFFLQKQLYGVSCSF